MKEKEENRTKIPSVKIKRYTVTIEKSLYQKIDDHIRIIKHFEDHTHTKKRWVLEAVREKLEKDKINLEEVPKEKYLHIEINQKLAETINEKVELIKQFRSYSKKQWFLEAVQQKLDKEQEKKQRYLENIRNIRNKSMTEED